MPFISRNLINKSQNRQRTAINPDKLSDVKASIEANQLLHPISLRREGGKFYLVAGETRLSAMDALWVLGKKFKYSNELVPVGQVPYTDLGELSELEAETTELTENADRDDLSWQDKAAATARLHSIRSRQAQAEGRVHTLADTTVELKGRTGGSYQQAVKQSIILADHLANPAIAKASTAAEAFKILQKEEQKQQHKAHAAAIGSTFTADIHELHHTNCLSWMGTCDREMFDVILTDPPYGMGAAETFGGMIGGSTAIHDYEDTPESWRKLMAEWCPLSYRVAKPQSHAYIFCDISLFGELKQMMEAAGWYVFRTPFISVKPQSGRVPLPDQGPRRQWEMLLYAIKGKRPITGIYPDVISATLETTLGHGAQKPVSLYADLLRRSIRAGNTVLDCFAGSGTIFPAAHSLKCKAIGLEMNETYYGMSAERLAKLKTDGEVVQQTDAKSGIGDISSILSASWK